MGKRKSKRNKSQWVLEESRLELFYSLITIQIAAAAQAAQITIQIALPSSSPRAPLELPHHHHHHHHHHPYYVWRWFETEALTLPQLRTFPSTSQLHCGGQPTRKPSTDADAEVERMSSQHGGGGVREHGVHRPLTTVMENCFGAFDDRGG